MERLEDCDKEFHEAAKRFWDKIGPGSKTAMGVLMFRFLESRKPEGERNFYDPYAIHFIDKDLLEWEARNPDEVKALLEQYERFLPGIGNYIVARTLVFDDFVRKAIDEDLEQLVILGAGYDSRAYRIDGLKMTRVFEVDHPSTQEVKKEKLEKVFGSLQDHVIYISADLEGDDFGQKLIDGGYDSSKRTLFLMEGVLSYLSHEAVDNIFSFIAKNSCKRSSIVFSIPPLQSTIDGSCNTKVGKNTLTLVSLLGEPMKSGIREGGIEPFLSRRGFRLVSCVTFEDIKKAYFHAPNEGWSVQNPGHIAHAVIK